MFHPKTKYIQQWQIVIRRRNGEHGVPAEIFVRDHLGIVSFDNKLLHLLLESHRPIKSLNPMVTPGIGVQIVDNIAAAKHWVSVLNGHVGMFKVGKQLFTAYGPDVVRMIEKFGAGIFLDLKYHDIPNTVAMATVEAARLGVQLCNLHALGGYEMMARTMETLDREFPPGERSRVLAVTILTSSTEDTLRDVGIERPLEEMVVRLALLAKKAVMQEPAQNVDNQCRLHKTQERPETAAEPVFTE